MAKLFEQVEEREEPPVKRTRLSPEVTLLLLWCIITFVAISVFMIEEKKEREINKNKSMKLVELAKMDNGQILTVQVRYLTFKKIDPEDTSDIFFEVVNGDDTYKPGMLVKFNHRFIQPQQIEGETYCVIDTKQILFHLEEKDVKKDLLKR